MTKEQHQPHLEERGANLLFLNALVYDIKSDALKSVLEIGCGTGTLAEYLSTILDVEVIGTETSKYAYDIAKTKIRCHYQPEGGIPDEYLGRLSHVYCKDVLPLNANKMQFYQGVYDSLISNGKFYTYMPDTDDINSKPILKYIPSSIENSLMRYESIANNISALKTVGFKEVQLSSLNLGTVRMDSNYVSKHRDGYFSNTDDVIFENARFNGLKKFEDIINILSDYGIISFYKWERIMITAKK